MAKIIFQQLNCYLTDNQSDFPHVSSQRNFSFKVVNEMRINTDDIKMSVLVLLDLNSAFDPVDQWILLERLRNWVGVPGTILQWFESYLHIRDG